MTTTYDWAFVDPTTGNISHIMSIQDNNQISIETGEDEPTPDPN